MNDEDLQEALEEELFDALQNDLLEEEWVQWSKSMEEIEETEETEASNV